MEIELEEEDQVKLKYLVRVMIASRSSRKSNYATRLQYFDEGERSDFTVKASWLNGFPGSSCPTDQRMGIINTSFLRRF